MTEEKKSEAEGKMAQMLRLAKDGFERVEFEELAVKQKFDNILNELAQIDESALEEQLDHDHFLFVQNKYILILKNIIRKRSLLSEADSEQSTTVLELISEIEKMVQGLKMLIADLVEKTSNESPYDERLKDLASLMEESRAAYTRANALNIETSDVLEKVRNLVAQVDSFQDQNFNRLHQPNS